MEMNELVEKHRAFYKAGATLDVDYRIKHLKLLHQSIVRNETLIEQALYADLHKSEQESFLTEIALVLNDLKYQIRKVKKWSKLHYKPTPLFMFPSKSYTFFEPLGVVLIMSPWNYPFLLLMSPLIGAISAGNCVVLKPSHQTPHINEVMAKIVQETFSEEYVSFMDIDTAQTHELMQQRFDFIFFTGSTHFGKEVMAAATPNLTPMVLELGGKSPCVVTQHAHIDLAAKRIVWAKFINSGQTCVAPDHLIVHESVVDQLIEALKKYITQFYGEEPLKSSFYPHMINQGAFERVTGYFQDGDVIFGGTTNPETITIAPTIMRNIKPDSDLAKTEVFGPIIPIATYQEICEVIESVNTQEKPLALYYFGDTLEGEKFLRQSTSGGACINDVLMHIGNHHLPFGGVGNSGMGKYHGKHSYKAFSNERSVVSSSTLIDFAVKYIPYKHWNFTKKLILK